MKNFITTNARILPPFAQAVSAEQTKGGKTACANGVQEYVRQSTIREVCTKPAQEVAVLIRALGQNRWRDLFLGNKKATVKRRTKIIQGAFAPANENMKNDKYTKPHENKFHQGNRSDGKHYWLTPPKLMEDLQLKFDFDFDPCPYPKPVDFDGLTCEWGKSNYVNPPFGSIMHQGAKDKKPKKKGMTAWVRKAIEEHKKGKRVVMVYPIDKWVLMLVEAGATISNLGDVKWVATEDGSEGKGTGRHIAQFVLEPK